MDHYYASAHDLSQPWRTRTLVVSAIAVVELLALVAVGLAVLGKGWFESERAGAVRNAAHHRAAAAQTMTPPKTHAKPKLHATAPARPLVSRAHTSVLVLNGNGRSGAAGAEASVLRAHGYPVAAVGNAKRNDYAASIVMYRPGYDREARRLGHDLGISVVTGLDGVLPSELHGARLLVIVGT
jgi:hypothetical protein